MDPELQKIIQKAINEEQFFIDFYSRKSEDAEKPSIKELFKRLSEQETEHKKKLQSFDYESTKSLSPEKLSAINLHEDLMLSPLDEYKEIKDSINFAIRAEQNAQEMYNKLAEAVEEGSDLFMMLAEEEKKHEDLLKEELDNLEI